MRVTAIETVHVGGYPNITFVEVRTDEGLSGLGETFRTPRAVAAQIHETVAPYLLGKDPLAIDAHSDALLNAYLRFGASSVEVRAAWTPGHESRILRSALDWLTPIIGNAG